MNEVGVDINFAVDHYHYQTMIQFVCGIGPRKGSALLKVIRVRIFSIYLKVLTLSFNFWFNRHPTAAQAISRQA